MDRLVELFIQSARYGESGEPSNLSDLPQDGGRLDAEGIEHGVTAIEKMLTSEDGARMGANPAATFVCLAMALEEKPLLQAGAARCYEKGLDLLDKIRQITRQEGGSWERAVILQQLGAVCLRQRHSKDAARWLEECAVECGRADGHPRDAVLFDGAFNTQQTRLDFIGTVEKLCCKIYQDLGDEVRARQHYEEVQRLSRMQSCDAVERAVARDEAQQPNATAGQSARETPSGPAPLDPKALWAATDVTEKRFSEYRFADEGPTVLLTLDLNDHLGIGEEASKTVESLKQFRVKCEDECVDVCVRLQRENGSICQFQLLLQPLVYGIIPEDTVPRLKGREGKRRLEVKLFKRDKAVKWNGGDIVKSHHSSKPKTKANAKAKAADRTQGTMLNPLTAEELAKLPRPSTTGGDNRPSSWQTGPVLLRKEEPAPPAPAASTNTTRAAEAVPTAPAAFAPTSRAASSRSPSKTATVPEICEIITPSVALPPWVADVEERRPVNGGLEFDVHLAAEAGENVGMADLELDGDEVCLRLSLRGAEGSPLELATSPGVDMDALKARWRRKTRVLELRLPSA